MDKKLIFMINTRLRGIVCVGKFKADWKSVIDIINCRYIGTRKMVFIRFFLKIKRKILKNT